MRYSSERWHIYRREVFKAIALRKTLCKAFELVGCRCYGKILFFPLGTRIEKSSLLVSRAAWRKRRGQPWCPAKNDATKGKIFPSSAQKSSFQTFSHYAKSHFGSIHLLCIMLDGLRNFHCAYPHPSRITTRINHAAPLSSGTRQQHYTHIARPCYTYRFCFFAHYERKYFSKGQGVGAAVTKMPTTWGMCIL